MYQVENTNNVQAPQKCNHFDEIMMFEISYMKNSYSQTLLNPLIHF